MFVVCAFRQGTSQLGEAEVEVEVGDGVELG